MDDLGARQERAKEAYSAIGKNIHFCLIEIPRFDVVVANTSQLIVMYA